MSRHEFDYEAFSKAVNAGQPITFGPSQHLYEQKLQPSPHYQRILLLGCAPQSLEEFIRFIDGINSQAQMYIMDVSPTAMIYLFDRWQKLDQATQTRVHLIHGDTRDLGIKNNSIDLCLTHLLFHNLAPSDWAAKAEARRAIREINRVLKPGGVFMSVDKASFWEPSIDNILVNVSIQIAQQTLENTGFVDVSATAGGTISREEYALRHELNVEEYRGNDRFFGYIISFGIKSQMGLPARP